MDFGLRKHTRNGFITWAQVLWPAIFLFIILPGCKITQELENDELLVNKIHVNGIKDKGMKEDARSLIKQEPNKRLFGFWRFYLRAYNFGMRGDTSAKIRRWVRNKIGEPPVILDSARLDTSVKRLTIYFENRGYFEADVRYEVKKKNKRSKKANIIFYIDQKTPYYINKIDYGINDRKLYYKILEDTLHAVMREGDRYDADKLAEERDRITKKLRNEGYYFFNKEYISFLVDTSLKANYVNVNLQIRNPDYFKTHKKYYIGKVYVNVVNPVYSDTFQEKTSWHEVDSNIWVNLNGYRLNAQVITGNLQIKPGELFSQNNVDNSYYRFNGIQLFRQSIINFDTLNDELLCYISLYPMKRQEYILEPQLITSDQNNAVEQSNLRNYGIANIITIRNKNMFSNAELFELRYRFSFEGQFRKNDSLPFFNNIEHTITPSLSFTRAKILTPIRRWFDVKSDRSALVGNYVYESNIDFRRKVISLGYNELFNIGLHTVNITLGEVSYNRTDAKRNFLALVNPADSIFIANLYTTNLIEGSRVSWIYTDKPISRDGSFFYSRLMLESAGFLLRNIMRATNQPIPSDGRYKIDNVNFEQFVKLDADVRYTKPINELNSMAYRVHMGIGWAYGNSDIMPFVRRYFIGGANSLRGWRPRTLGPGSFNSSLPGVRADRSGEMILEAQSEYRFTIIRPIFQGALFVDAGNIWYAKPLAGRTEVEIRRQTFFDQIAVNTGFGLRFDFSFFILRFDFGLPLRTPELPSRDRWLFDEYADGTKKFFPSLVFNLGLNYPF